MRALAYQPTKPEQKDIDGVHLRTLLSKGVDCGILVGYKSSGKNYFFLNSDLRLSPKPIIDGARTTDPVAIEVVADHRVGEILGEVALLPGTRAASTCEMPIPNIEGEKKLILWLSWLTTPIKREILAAIARDKVLSRPELRRQLGFWADRLAIYDGVATGVLSLDSDKNLAFQFSKFDLHHGTKEHRPTRWIENPPSFMLSRSYEPLSCVDGGAAALDELRRFRISPLEGLLELESKGREIIPHKRKRTIGSNFLQLTNYYGTFDSVPKFRNVSSAILKPLPDRILANSRTQPLVWVNDTRMEMPAIPTILPSQASASRILAIKRPLPAVQSDPSPITGNVESDRVHHRVVRLERKLPDIRPHVDMKDEAAHQAKTHGPDLHLKDISDD